MNKRLTFLIFNFLGLQITWAACAYGAIKAQPMFGVIAGVTYLILHFMLTPSRRTDLITLLSLSTIGILLDYANMQFGVLGFNAYHSSGFIPLWLVALWCVFTLMIPHSLYWLRKKPLLAFILGGIGGSSSYWLGHKLGAINLHDPLFTSVGIYFIQWAIFIPVAFIIYRIIKQNTYCSNFTQA